jgi:hypothetical protein
MRQISERFLRVEPARDLDAPRGRAPSRNYRSSAQAERLRPLIAADRRLRELVKQREVVELSEAEDKAL